MVFPQSGGENQGGKFNKGKAKIKKNPTQKSHLKRLIVILIYDIIKNNLNPYEIA